MSVKPDTAKALEFLRRWNAGGPWVLTAITTDKKSIDTKTFTSDQSADAFTWIDKYTGVRNIYFHVNSCMRHMTSKAEREDVKSLDWLHVDIDPRAGEDLAEERRRALAQLQSPPGQLPKPTVIIFSGGGYQAFWKLREPVAIDGNLELAEEAKLYNQQLEVVFGADNCHNVDRIMRLPGTINVPDERKLKKGRTPTLAALVEFDETRVYDVTQFHKARKTQLKAEKGTFVRDAVEISANAERLNDVSDLDKWHVPDRIKVIIVNGRHPDEGTKPRDDSRSAWLFDALCGLARSGVPNDVILSVVTDPDFLISASVLDKGGNAERFAKRQIQRACDNAIDPALQELNDRHALIESYGGRCLIVEEVEDVLGPRLDFQPVTDFKNRYANRQIQVGTKKGGEPVMAKLGDWWFHHPQRRQYHHIVFSPGYDIPNTYNLWKGFACDALPGDCSLLLAHIRENICKGNQIHYDYLISWMATCVQTPNRPGHTAVILRGAQGTGKGTFVKAFGSLFGRHFLQVSDPKHLVGSFNSHLQSCLVLFGDEAFFAGDKRHESVLKTMVTETTMTIEKKGVDMIVVPNFVHLIMASNSDWVVPFGPRERRYFVLDVADDQQQKVSYFKAIEEQLANGGKEALLYFLMNYQLGDFNIRSVPKTAAGEEQQEHSFEPVMEWWYRKLREGRVLPCHDVWFCEVPKEYVLTDFVEHCKQYNVTRRGNPTSMGRFLAKAVPGLGTFQRDATIEVTDARGLKRNEVRRVYHYRFPNLDACRAAFEKQQGTRDWDHVPTNGEGYGEQPSHF